MTDDRSYDEPLPWLAAVEDEDEPRGISARRMLAALIVVILAAGIIARHSSGLATAMSP